MSASTLNPRAGWTPEDFYQEQLFDADCNNCKHLERVKFDRKVELPHIYGSPAFCTQFQKHVRTNWPGFFANRPCFEHRKTGERGLCAGGVEAAPRFVPFHP